MTGTWINVGAVLAGSTIGLLLGARFSDHLKETVMQGIGVVTLLIGLKMAFTTQNVLIVLGSILLGGLVGTWWRLDERLNRFGLWVEHRLTDVASGKSRDQQEEGLEDRRKPGQSGTGRFAQGFITTSLLFCIGPMTFLGAIQDGLSGDYQLLAIKSVLDGFSAIAFAASLGAGVMLSTLTVLVIQGSLTMMSSLFQTLLTDAVIAELTATGGVLVLMIGLGLLHLVSIRVANFLPALLFAPLLLWVADQLTKLM